MAFVVRVSEPKNLSRQRKESRDFFSHFPDNSYYTYMLSESLPILERLLKYETIRYLRINPNHAKLKTELAAKDMETIPSNLLPSGWKNRQQWNWEIDPTQSYLEAMR